MKIYRIIFFLKERAFYHLKQQIVPSRCKDIFFFSSNRDNNFAMASPARY